MYVCIYIYIYIYTYIYIHIHLCMLFRGLGRPGILSLTGIAASCSKTFRGLVLKERNLVMRIGCSR